MIRVCPAPTPGRPASSCWLAITVFFPLCGAGSAPTGPVLSFGLVHLLLQPQGLEVGLEGGDAGAGGDETCLPTGLPNAMPPNGPGTIATALTDQVNHFTRTAQPVAPGNRINCGVPRRVTAPIPHSGEKGRAGSAGTPARKRPRGRGPPGTPWPRPVDCVHLPAPCLCLLQWISIQLASPWGW